MLSFLAASLSQVSSRFESRAAFKDSNLLLPLLISRVSPLNAWEIIDNSIKNLLWRLSWPSQLSRAYRSFFSPAGTEFLLFLLAALLGLLEWSFAPVEVLLQIRRDCTWGGLASMLKHCHANTRRWQRQKVQMKRCSSTAPIRTWMLCPSCTDWARWK